nr:tetratricopeptide repeat protein [Candidatus Frankia alpina]
MRYLYQIGDFSTGLVEADRALVGWVADSGDRDPAVLILQGIKADILWALGRYPEAYELRRPVLDAITEVLGADLRSHGDFEAARELDEDSLARHRTVFGEEHQATLFAANNLAVDYTLTSSYARALETDQRNLADRRAAYTRDDAVWVVFSMAALARDLRHAGQYLDARELAEQAYLIYRDLVQRRILPASRSSSRYSWASMPVSACRAPACSRASGRSPSASASSSASAREISSTRRVRNSRLSRRSKTFTSIVST